MQVKAGIIEWLIHGMDDPLVGERPRTENAATEIFFS